MKDTIIALNLLILVGSIPTRGEAQGKFAGNDLKKMVGAKYSDRKNIPWLPGYILLNGVVLTEKNDPQPMMLEMYWKGRDRVLLFVNQLDSVTHESQVLDILVIKNVDSGWVVKTGACRDGANNDITIVALLNPGYNEYSTMIKQAWRCNRDKIRFEAIRDIKNISCLNDGFEVE
jgi:hypothetical protein